MTNTTAHSTLISLFHTREQAQETLAELQRSGIAASAVQTIEAGEAGSDALTSALQKFDLPDRDLRILSDGLQSGGTVIVVRADGEQAEIAEDIFKRHNSHQVDEQTIGDRDLAAVPVSSDRAPIDTQGEMSLPVVEEELMVGKRAVQAGGVRVISRVTDTPVTESINLRQEHARIEHRPVEREATEADFRSANQVIEVEETDEEAVVAKKARVVEEVFIDKEMVEHTQVVSDTVRRTEIEVEPVTAGTTNETVRPRVARSDKEII